MHEDVLAALAKLPHVVLKDGTWTLQGEILDCDGSNISDGVGILCIAKTQFELRTIVADLREKGFVVKASVLPWPCQLRALRQSHLI